MAHLDRLECKEVFERLEDYVDRELSPHEMRLMEEHLDLCAWCAREYRFEQSVLLQVREKVRRIPVPEDLMSRIAAAIRSAPEPAS